MTQLTEKTQTHTYDTGEADDTHINNTVNIRHNID